MQKYFEEVDDIDIRKIEINISGRAAEILYEGKPLKEYDCVYVKGSFRFAQLLQTLTSLLEKKCYMPISADAFTIAHDKLLTHLELQKSNIPMPKTYVSATVDAAKKILEKINFPVMMKFPHGTGGKGVMFADSYASASSLLDASGYSQAAFHNPGVHRDRRHRHQGYCCWQQGSCEHEENKPARWKQGLISIQEEQESLSSRCPY